VLGSDGTGEVTALGEGVDGFAVGQHVVILPGVSSGTSEWDARGLDHLAPDYGIRGEHCDGIDCEVVSLEARYLLPLPDGVDPVRAAAVPLVFLTAHEMLVGKAKLAPGETVLVIGGASGVGSAAIQIARDLGARVIATAGSDEKLALARELGAVEAVDHRADTWPKEVKRLTDGRGCDVVVEHVGPATWRGSLASLGRRGRLVTCGGTTGATVQLVLPHLFSKNQSVLGSTMGPAAAFPGIFARVAAGAYRPVVDRVLPLSAAPEAHARLEAREAVGKIVLVPGD
jgi:NADPH:quinone reductase-like Zn-dependent oxidoreductase